MHHRLQNGSLRKRERSQGPAVWQFRYRVIQPDGTRRLKGVTLGSVIEYPNVRSLQPKLDALLAVNEAPTPQACTLVSELIDRFTLEEGLSEIKAGNAMNAPLHYATACAYLTILKKYILPKWGRLELSLVRPVAVQDWLNKL